MTPVITIQDLRLKYAMNFPQSKEAYYTSLINMAQETVAQYIGYDSDLISCSVVEYFDSKEVTDRLVLSVAPVSVIESIVIGRENATLLSASSYRINNKNGIVKLYDVDVPEGSDVVKVSYKAGWQNNTVPEDLKLCIALTVQNIARLTQNGMVGVTQRTTDGGSETIENKFIPSAVMWQLDRYCMKKEL